MEHSEVNPQSSSALTSNQDHGPVHPVLELLHARVLLLLATNRATDRLEEVVARRRSAKLISERDLGLAKEADLQGGVRFMSRKPLLQRKPLAY